LGATISAAAADKAPEELLEELLGLLEEPEPLEEPELLGELELLEVLPELLGLLPSRLRPKATSSASLPTISAPLGVPPAARTAALAGANAVWKATISFSHQQDL
jgi:hypothetical protein